MLLKLLYIRVLEELKVESKTLFASCILIVKINIFASRDQPLIYPFDPVSSTKKNPIVTVLVFSAFPDFV